MQPDPSVRGKYLRPDSELEVVALMWHPITLFPEEHLELKTFELVVLIISNLGNGSVVHQAWQLIP